MSKRFLLTVLALTVPTSSAQDVPYCGDEGVWLQILGSGGADLTDQRSAASYLVWNGEHARVMIDTGSGAALRFDEAGADFADLDAIVFTRLQANTVDFPSLVEGSLKSGRDRVLPVFGPAVPDGESTTAFVGRLMGPDGAYGYLSRFLTVDSPASYRINVRDVLAIGTRRWSEKFAVGGVGIAAIPVHHGGLPALAWRVEIDGFSVVFAGGFSNRKGTVANFAKDADALVVHHAISESARGRIRELYLRPSELGRIATEAKVRMLVLGHRTTRTLGMETINRGAIREQYTGPLIFADELECWGL